jgi:hypothetical protein
MALARFKDLCIDAVDPEVLGGFWAALLGLDTERTSTGTVLRGARPTDTIWVNRVPEPRTVKHRLHLDVEVAAVDPLLAAGATVLAPPGESGGSWARLADPEGGEFCAFPRDGHPPDPPATLYELVLDTVDADSSRAQATWWAEVLGGKVEDDGRGFWWVAEVEDVPFATLDLIPVGEPKRAKNRLHLDVVTSDVAALRAHGATVLAAPTDATPWHVLADPEGNEFCAFTSD